MGRVEEMGRCGREKKKEEVGGRESIYTQTLPVPIGKYLYFCQHSEPYASIRTDLHLSLSLSNLECLLSCSVVPMGE
jgi:hypothetical protein